MVLLVNNLQGYCETYSLCQYNSFTIIFWNLYSCYGYPVICVVITTTVIVITSI